MPDRLALKSLLSLQRVRELAGSASFARGEDYVAQHRVRSLAEHRGAISATVRGSQEYRVSFSVKDHKLRHRCTCPIGRDGDFCKHGAALALAWLGQEADTAAATSVVKLDDLRPFLLAQEKPRLADWLLDVAERDDHLRERMLREAARAQGGQIDLGSLRRAIDRAAATDDFIGYDEAYGFAENFREAAIEPLRELLETGAAAEVVDLAEHALRRIEDVLENADDSDGDIGGLLSDLQELHLAACHAARPDPEALARRLFEWELHGHWDVFHGAVKRYADVLGEQGRTTYRALAKTRWAALPTLTPGSREDHSGPRYRLTRMMEGLACADGDVDTRIAIKAKDLSHAYAYLRIAELLMEAKRPAEALDWAERGIEAFSNHTDPRLLDFLAERYHDLGRHDDAMAIAWRRFDTLSSLETYRLLKSNAERASGTVWPGWREKALALLRTRIAATGAIRRKAFAFECGIADRSTLVEIHLSEHDAEAAWREAQTGPCTRELTLRLAGIREKTHPADAIPLYLGEAGRLIAQKDNRAYQEAVRHLQKVKALHLSLDEADKWAVLHARLCAEHKPKRNFMALLRIL